MTGKERASTPEAKVEQELEDMVTRATAGPGVLDLMRLYEGAERVYASTVPELRIWITSSTTER